MKKAQAEEKARREQEEIEEAARKKQEAILEEAAREAEKETVFDPMNPKSGRSSGLAGWRCRFVCTGGTGRRG